LHGGDDPHFQRNLSALAESAFQTIEISQEIDFALENVFQSHLSPHPLFLALLAFWR
jgi:hypothetical protein